MIDIVYSLFANPFIVALLMWVIGDVVVERSGVINIAIDGSVAFSIAVAFVATQHLGLLLGFIATVLSTLCIALLMMTFINVFHVHHVLTGLTLNIALYGLGALIGLKFMVTPSISTLAAPKPLLVFLGIAVTAIVYILLYRTRLGIAIGRVD